MDGAARSADTNKSNKGKYRIMTRVDCPNCDQNVEVLSDGACLWCEVCLFPFYSPADEEQPDQEIDPHDGNGWTIEDSKTC